MAVVRLGCSVATCREREREGERERERERAQNGEKENVQRRERGQENVGCRYGQGGGGRGWQSEVENGRERGTKGPAKGVTKRAGAEGDGGGTRRGRAARSREKAIDAHPLTRRPSLPRRRATPRSSGGGRHGGACKSAWRRDALPRPSPSTRSLCARTYTRGACTRLCAYLARVYTHHWRNQSIDRATDRPTGRQAGKQANNAQGHSVGILGVCYACLSRGGLCLCFGIPIPKISYTYRIFHRHARC